jgi:SAM-dependent methyltransferase
MLDVPNQTASTLDFEFAALGEARNYRRALFEQFARTLTGVVVEVGAGIGQFSSQLLDLPGVTRLVAIEPNRDFCRRFRCSYPKIDLVEGTIKDLPEAFGLCHSILSINVLEHIRDDELELSDYHRLLLPAQGHLNLFVPARQEIYAPIDADFGHYRRYRRADLSVKLQRAGFKVDRLHYFNSVGYLAWWFNFCLLKRHQFKSRSVRVFDRWIFPAVYRLESRLMFPPLGQSLLAVARAV